MNLEFIKLCFAQCVLLASPFIKGRTDYIVPNSTGDLLIHPILSGALGLGLFMATLLKKIVFPIHFSLALVQKIVFPVHLSLALFWPR